MRITGRWADWLALITGIAVVISHIWHQMLGFDMVVLFLTGVLITFLACLSIIHPELFVAEAVLVAAGLFLIATPWILGFDTSLAAALTSWIGGAITVLAGLANLPAATALYRRIVPPQPKPTSGSAAS
ncbi:hypothetical protein GCM10027570_49540 [Streptomonospora sediminis]